MTRPLVYVKSDLEQAHLGSPERATALGRLKDVAEIVYYDGVLDGDRADEQLIAILAGGQWIEPAFYGACSRLRLVARWGVGFEKTRIEVATEHGVLVSISPMHMNTVAEYALTQWLATLKRIHTLNRHAHAGDTAIMTTYEAEGSCLGIYGFGRIGQEMAKRARPLLGDGGRLLVYDVRPDIGELADKFGAEVVADPVELFRQCDCVSLHMSGDEPVVFYEQLVEMQPHASLINPSRGNLVLDADVKRALDEDRLAYYVIDDPLTDARTIYIDHPKVIATNHNAGITGASMARLDACTVDQILDVIARREPPHVLNTEALQHPRVQAWLTQ
jgi:D-3-phosphoglycerate dehydrogenase